MCYIRRQLMFCFELVVDDDVRRRHMTSWKLEFIILPRPSFGARCPRQGLSPGLYLCSGSVLWFLFGWIPFRALLHQSNIYRGHHSAQHVLLLLILNLKRKICLLSQLFGDVINPPVKCLWNPPKFKFETLLLKFCYCVCEWEIKYEMRLISIINT